MNLTSPSSHRLMILWLTVMAVVVATGGCRKKSQPPAELLNVTESDKSMTIDLGKDLRLELVKIPAGGFQMGSPESDADGDVSEKPQHAVAIAKPLFMGKYEVTQAQWMLFRGNQSANRAGGEYPAECIAWTDAVDYCKFLSEKTGRTVRLPAEAEWEYACRGGASTRFALGDTLTAGQANFHEAKTKPVGSYPPNAVGLYDMHGNVAEWCGDTAFHSSYEDGKPPADGAAWNSGGDAANRPYRGGAYNNDAVSCRSAMRFANTPDTRGGTVGFRVVVEAR